MKKIGKIGQRNLDANKKLKEIYIANDITTCEVGLDRCWRNNGLTFAHKHKREWYRKKPELLSDFNQTVLACMRCHTIIEADKSLTEKIFNKLRPCGK